jgi:hypothetical protein
MRLMSDQNDRRDAAVVESLDERIRSIGLRHLRPECITAELLSELAREILATETLDDGEDGWIERWFIARVQRAPHLGPQPAPEGGSMFDKMLAAKDRMTPKVGANLVGFDDFEEQGDELYMIGHFASVEEAEAAKAERLKENPDEVVFVYTPS